MARCLASAAFTAALPGKAWLDRGPDTPAGNYAIFTLAPDGDPEWFSDSSYLQGYTLRMVAYTVTGLAGDHTPPLTGATPAAQAAQLAMAAAINPGPTTWDALRAGSVNVCLPKGWSGQFAPELREGKDVYLAAAEWRLLIEGDLTP